MNATERLIRASLDHIVLAVAALADGDTATAQVHATLAGALNVDLSTTVQPLTGARAGGASTAHRAGPRAEAVEQWIADIEAFNVPAAPEPVILDTPAPDVGNIPEGRRRVLERRGRP